MLCLFAATPAHAITVRPSTPKADAQAKATIRKTPKPPKHDQVHRGGVDGTITLIQFVSNRRQHDDQHKDGAAPHGSAAQVRASSQSAEPSRRTTLTARPVESLPPHWASTHLCI